MTQRKNSTSKKIPVDPSKLIEFRYQLWTRLCELADETMSIADAWWETDPDLVELHYRRCGIRQGQLFDEEPVSDNDDNQ